MFSRVKLFEMCVFFTSQYFRESILNDIRKARNLFTGKELAAELARIRQRVDNIEVLTADIVINLLLSYRDIQVRRCSKCVLGSMLGEEGMLVLDFSQLIGNPRCSVEPTDNFPPRDFMMRERDSHMGTTEDYDILIFTPQLLRYPVHGGSVLCCEPRAHLSVSQWELCSGKEQTFLLLSECIFYCLKLCCWKLTVPGTRKMQLILCKIAIDPVTRHTDTLYHLYCYLLDIFKIWKVG